MNLIEKALEIALSAHKGQSDKAGKPYILHPLRVMSKMAREDEMAVALLHDVIEDSAITADSLLRFGIPSTIVDAVTCLTKQAGESYDRFIDRICQNDLARRVKIADIEDNLNILRLDDIESKDLERIAKYHKAWKKLNS